MQENACGGEAFALRVEGQDMEPEFFEGNIILVDPSAVLTNGSFVVVQIDGKHVFRQLRIVGDEHLVSTLETGAHESRVYDLQDFAGVVVQKSERHRNKRRVITHYG